MLAPHQKPDQDWQVAIEITGCKPGKKACFFSQFTNCSGGIDLILMQSEFVNQKQNVPHSMTHNVRNNNGNIFTTLCQESNNNIYLRSFLNKYKK